MLYSYAGIPKRNPNYLSLKLKAVALMREGVTPMTLFAVAICRLFERYDDSAFSAFRSKHTLGKTIIEHLSR